MKNANQSKYGENEESGEVANPDEVAGGESTFVPPKLFV